MEAVLTFDLFSRIPFTFWYDLVFLLYMIAIVWAFVLLAKRDEALTDRKSLVVAVLASIIIPYAILFEARIGKRWMHLGTWLSAVILSYLVITTSITLIGK